jgi:cytochrome c oxidase assembly protein subunit 19
MEREEMERLGFSDDVSWESEEAEKKYLFEKINERKNRALENTSR